MHNTKTDGVNKEGKAGQIIHIEQEQLTRHLDNVVRGTVEQTLNELLDAEADRLCQAKRYERSDKRRDTRAGYYTRNLSTKAGLDVLELLRQAVDDLGRTVLLVTHNPRDAAFADQVRFLKDGELLPEIVEGADRDEARITDRMAILGI